MASIEYRARTTRVIAYDRRNKIKFALGAVTKKAAERFANRIDDLIASSRMGIAPSKELASWLADLSDDLHQILVDNGYVKPRQKMATLTEFIDGYIAGRTDVTERRRGKLRVAGERLVNIVGDIPLDEMTPGLADKYSRDLTTELASATAQKECQIAAQFFRHAYRLEIIERNPFEGVTIGHAVNEDRQEFVERERVDKVIEKCPDNDWRTIVTLARYGGLRCPSEVALLTWDDILWDEERMVVTSPKTERYGKGSRTVPLFPEVRRQLENVFDIAEPGTVHVVPSLGGNPDKNIGTRFRKIIKRSEVEPWLKPFQNLRLSRQTELEQDFASYVVCKWMGNTEKVANKHYLKVTDEHFAKAAAVDWLGKSGDKLGTKPPATSGNRKKGNALKPGENTTFAEIAGYLESVSVAEKGLEPPTRGL